MSPGILSFDFLLRPNLCFTVLYKVVVTFEVKIKIVTNLGARD